MVSCCGTFSYDCYGYDSSIRLRRLHSDVQCVSESD